MISFSASEMIRDLRSGPATIRSRASSNSAIPIVLRLRRGGGGAGARERRVEDVGPVGGRDDDDVRVGVEAVHLDEDLVEGLLALVVAATKAGAALAAGPVDLVPADDPGGVALG